MSCIQAAPLTDYLRLVSPFVSADLIDAAGWAGIEAIAQQLPSEITNFFGFECRLGTEDAKADFLLCVGADQRGRALLAGSEPAEVLPDRLLQHPVWKQIRRFSSSWQQETSPLHATVDNIWLEFDVDGSSDPCPIPSCFFGSQAIRHNTAAHTWVTSTAIPLLQGKPLVPGIEQQLFRCFHALPDNVYVFQLGLMLARQSEQVRICLRGILPEHILAYLTQVGWPGSIQTLQPLLQTLSTLVERIDLDLDVGEWGVSTKLGLECYLSRQPKFEPRWQSFLDELVDTGLCLPQKRAAILAYPGFVREKTHRDRFPPSLVKLSRFLGHGHETVFMRGLHHIKVVFQSDRPLEAKAYGWVTHRLLSKAMFALVPADSALTPLVSPNLTS